MKSFYLRTLSFVCFDGDDDAAAKAAAEKAAAEEAAKKAAEGDEKKFTQEEVNTFLAKEKRKTQETQKQLATQLSEYKKTAKLSGDERTDLQKQIDDLQKQYMTVEEVSRQKAEKAAKQYNAKLDDAQAERDTWKDRYTHSTISAAIATAAVENDAISVDQIGAMLQSRSKLSERVDEEGQPTGAFEPRVDFDDLDKDEKPITLNLTIPEAVKRMTELPQYGNLFKGSKHSGLGGTSGTGKKAGKLDLVKIAREDPARYRKLRKEQPEVFAQL